MKRMYKYHLLLSALVAFSLLSCTNKNEAEYSDDALMVDNNTGILKSADTKSIINISSNIVDSRESDYIFGLLFPKAECHSVHQIETEFGIAARIYNLDNGWVAISGDKRMAPVVGSDFKENLDLSKCENKGILLWLDMIKDEFNALQHSCMAEYTTEYSAFWEGFANEVYLDKDYKDYLVVTKDSGTMYYWRKEFQYSYSGASQDTVTIPHLVKTAWGQSYPWNSGFPIVTYDGVTDVCPAGCVAVAMGQSMKYYHDEKNFSIGIHHNVSYTMPNDTVVQVNLSNYVQNSTRWQSMAKKFTDTGVSYVRDLLLEIGGRIGMKYRPNGSSASLSPSGYAEFDIECQETPYYSRDVFFDVVQSQLSTGNPINVSADYYDTTNETCGHAWIIDGYVTTTTPIYYVYTWQRYEMPTAPGVSPISDHIIIVDPDPYGGPVNNHEFDHEIGEVVIERRDMHSYSLLMNWGYNGSGDSGHYSIESSDAWSYNSFDYVVNKKILYGFEQ